MTGRGPKAKLVERAFWEACPYAPSDFAEIRTRLIRTDKPDPATNEEAVAILKISAKDPDERKVGRAFSNAVIELALASIPGFFGVGGGFLIVPALVLFSIGGIAATVGTPSWLVWTISVVFGFIQAFTYAEIAGLFPSKSGGASVYGAAAWVRYSRLIAPLSVWCNWLAWTPVLAIGCGIAAGYMLNAFFPVPGQEAVDAAVAAGTFATADEAAAALTPAIRAWEIQFLDLSFLKDGLTLRINATFFIGAVLMLIVFAIQHRGILGTARVQTIIGIAVIVPLLIIGIVPLVTGDVATSNLTPLAPGLDPATAAWDRTGWTLFMGGLFIAAWSAYAFETAIGLAGRSCGELASLGHAYGLAGQPRRARELLSELETRSREEYVSPVYFSAIHAGLGDGPAALEWLDRAYRERSSWLVFVGCEPWWDPLRGDARFDDLVRRVGVQQPRRVGG